MFETFLLTVGLHGFPLLPGNQIIKICKKSYFLVENELHVLLLKGKNMLTVKSKFEVMNVMSPNGFLTVGNYSNGGLACINGIRLTDDLIVNILLCSHEIRVDFVF